MNAETKPKIRILLIDDNPVGLDNGALPRYAALPEGLKEYFELRWIATAGEAREFLDLTRMIARHDSCALSRVGTVPDIVVIDYSLTQDPRPLERRPQRESPVVAQELRRELEDLSPLMPLRQLVKTMGLPAPHQGEEYPHSHKQERQEALEKSQEGENYGCFVGGLIISSFADHPCAPVTVTVRESKQLEGTHTGMFQWLLLTESSGKLYGMGRNNIDWRRVLVQGVSLLRRKIEQLARVRAVSLSLDEVLRLVRKERLLFLTVESKYGVHRLPLEGLFLDHPKEKLFDEVQKWFLGDNGKSGLLEQLAGSGHFRDLSDAVDLADKLWATYEKAHIVRERFELGYLVSNLRVSDGKLTSTSVKRLQALWQRFSTEPFNLAHLAKKKGTRIVLDSDQVADIRSELATGKCSDISRRWASLLVIVRLLKRRFDAIQAGTEIDDLDENLSNTLAAPLKPYDVYLALFPVAKEPLELSLFTSGSGIADMKEWVDLALTASTGKRKNGKWGNIGLDVRDVLQGKAWFEGSSVSEKEWSHGLQDRDRPILEWYALSERFPKTNWDDFTRHVLNPPP
jgi:hypothetical protein